MKRRDPEQLNRPDVSDQGQLEEDTRVYTGSVSYTHLTLPTKA